ncbi:DnaJ domain protein [Aspergillus sclerotialis]|uniref:DnaJ domain protein n=1 Tax=Aspergillus sclerotialis TaxID=2070753 RepID=A0A3A2ZJX7_9EURO|nr:DnaJ domain protein [Aspergillus sclerotialis]
MSYLPRSQRLFQQLSRSTSIRPSSTGRTQRSIHVSSPKTQSPRGACILCQFRPQLVSHQQYNTLQTRHFTSTGNRNADGEAETTSNAPDVTNYYTIFPKTIPGGPPPLSPFIIPLADLKREFLQLQNISHPDKYPPGPAKQRAEALSAFVNEAYRTLVDPLNRAQYLLREMHDVDVTAEDGAAKHSLDPELLMEVMSVQETIEEISADPKAEETIERMKGENQERIEESIGTLAKAFDNNDIEGARKECVKLRFWYSVGEGLREWVPGTTEIRLVH